MMRALVAEFGKLKRSRMILWTALVVIGYTAIGLAVLPLIEKSVGVAPAAGSAMNAVGEAFASAGIMELNWKNAMLFIPMGVAGAWGTVLLSLVAAYVFGRELREGTDTATSTLPIRRESMMMAKLVVVVTWSVLLCLLAVVVDMLVVAVYLGLDTFAWSYVFKAFVDTVYSCIPILATIPLVGWLSLTRKGYMRPMLLAVVAFMIGNSMIGMDAAAYFPWSMPSVMVGVSWMPLRGDLSVASWAILLAVFVVGWVLVMLRANRIEEVA